MWSIGDTVNTVLAATGLAVAIVGLAIVYWQVRKARGAAEAAREATSEAMQVMARYVTAADLGSVRAGLRTILDSLQDLDNLEEGDRQSVWRRCQDVREHLIELHVRPGLEDQQGLLNTAITRVSEAQKALDDGDGAVDWGGVRRNVSAGLDSVLEVRQHALFLREEGADREQRP